MRLYEYYPKVTSLFIEILKFEQIKILFEANSKCSGSTFFGTPRMENCSQYSGSTIHTCMEVEPLIHRTASKVYLPTCKYLSQT